MPKISKKLLDQLGEQKTKIDWTKVLKTALGNERRLRGFHTSDPNADPALSGVEFLNVASVGELPVSAGNLAGFGSLQSATVKAAADLGTGVAILRLEGNGHSISFTLGLPSSGAEFTLPSSPTGARDEGLTFTRNAGVNAPVMLDSGTGPLSPALTDMAPHSVTLEDWQSGSAVAVGMLTFDTRMVNWVFDDPEIAANMGDVAVYHPNASVNFGDFDFGAIMFAQTNQANAVDGDEPVYQVLCGWTPTKANWDGYPAYSGYVYGQTDTFPKAYKVVIKTKSGAILKVHEMRDGLPINSDQLHDNDLANHPIRPHMNCAQLLPWSSVKAKMSSHSTKYLPGFHKDFLRPTVARQRFSANMANPFVSGRYNKDGIGNWYTVPKWAFAGNRASIAGDVSYDPHMQDLFTDGQDWGTLQDGASRSLGWGYEPATTGVMENLTGPGGSRHDRAVMPTPLAIWFSDKTYVRPRNHDAIEEMVDAWNLQYFNLSHYFIRDVKTFATLPFDETALGIWGHGAHTYYAGNDTYVAGGKAKTVPLFGIRNQNDDIDRDKNGRMQWNGVSDDYLHNYHTAGHTAIHFNSPMHAYATLHNVITSWLCQLGGDGGENPEESFMRRHQSWRMMHLGIAWKLRSSHPILGMKASTVEARIKRQLEAYYDYVSKPCMIDNSQYPFHVGLRNCGIALKWEGGEWRVAAQSQLFYTAHVLQMWKQFGLWSVAMKMSNKCEHALRFIIRCMDLASVDFIIDTNGANENATLCYADWTDYANPKIVSNWADQAYHWAPAGQQSWIRNADGSLVNNREQDITQHLRYQYVRIRLDYFPEIPCERANGLAQAAAKFEGWYQEITNNVAGNVSRDSDWTYFWGGLAALNPPTELGPA